MTVGVEHVGRLITIGAERSPRAPAVRVRNGGARTYRELESRTNRLANALLHAGCARGDRVAAWMEDTIEYVELIVAAAKAGLVVVPVNKLLTPFEAQHILGDSGARALFFTEELAERVDALEGRDELSLLVTNGAARVGGAKEFDELLASGADEAPEPPADDDLFIIAYTSGTTGLPKGAMLTHRTVKQIARINAMGYGLPMGGHAAFTASMSFVATVTSFIVSHFLVGGCVSIMGKWDVDELLDYVEREGCTFAYIPTPLLTQFAEGAARRPDSWEGLRTVLHSASKPDPRHLEAVADVVGDRLREGWGMTENSGGLVTITSPADMRGQHEAMDLFASAGRAAADCSVRLVGPDGAPVPHDGESVGELAVQSPALMVGYWRNEAATQSSLRDGWYYSGDLGSIDPGGYVYISDRRSDLIVSGGMNVYPTEVEMVIAEHPAVAECAVVGVAHPRWGQAVAAAVVTHEGVSLSADDVVEHCRTRLASYKKPTTVRFLDELPRTASNKVMRHVLREIVEGQTADA